MLQQDRLLTVIEVGALLKLAPRTVWKYLAAGKIPEPAVRDGRKFVRWRASDIQSFIANGGLVHEAAMS